MKSIKRNTSMDKMSVFQANQLKSFLNARGVKTNYTPSRSIPLTFQEQALTGPERNYTDIRKHIDQIKGGNFSGSKGRSAKPKEYFARIRFLEKLSRKAKDPELMKLTQSIKQKIGNIPRNEKTVITIVDPADARGKYNIRNVSNILRHELVHDWIKRARPYLKLNIARTAEEGLAEYVMLKSAYPHLPIQESVKLLPFDYKEAEYIKYYLEPAIKWEKLLEHEKIPLENILSEIETGKRKDMSKKFYERTIPQNLKYLFRKFKRSK